MYVCVAVECNDRALNVIALPSELWTVDLSMLEEM